MPTCLLWTRMYVFESLKRLTCKFAYVKTGTGYGYSIRSRKNTIFLLPPEILAAAIPGGAVQYHESSDKWVTYYKVDGRSIRGNLSLMSTKLRLRTWSMNACSPVVSTPSLQRISPPRRAPKREK